MPADSTPFRRVPRIAIVVLVGVGWAATALAGDPDDAARIRRAVAYLDGRQDDWARFGAARRGEGADATACVSCHTGLSYALARPSLRPFAATPGPATPEQRQLAAVGLRVEHRAELESPRFALMYDFDDRKKVESRGTEAVLNALILARADAAAGRHDSSPATTAALETMWAAQAAAGHEAGSWDWLNFGLEPWEGDGARAFGAALAALAVGSTPGYSAHPPGGAAGRGVRALRDYLRGRFPAESLHNRLWILEAAATFDGLLTPDQRREVVDQILAARRPDGGWSLAALGEYRRVDGTPQTTEPDAYATGLALRALRHGGAASRPAEVAGLAWLRSHQQDDGSWVGRSVNKQRNPTSFVGRLMADAGTAMAAAALAEAAAR